MDAILSELLKLVSGLLITVLAAWVTVRLAIRRFRLEQWWSRKADSYVAVFVASMTRRTSCEPHKKTRSAMSHKALIV